MACLEAVSRHGLRFLVPQPLARRFASLVEVKDDHNFPRAVDPGHAAHHFCEHWQGAYNVRFLEKVKDGEVLDWVLIWGQPRHTMRSFYDERHGKPEPVSPTGSPHPGT